MKNILILLMAVIMMSCVSEKRFLKKFPPKEQTITSDTVFVKRETIYKDTTVYAQISADTVFKIVEIRKLKNDTICQENDYSTACAWILGDMLTLDLHQKEQIIPFDLDNSVRETMESKSEIRTVYIEKVREVKYIPKFHQFTFLFFLSLATLLTGYIIVKLVSTPGNIWKRLLSIIGR